MKYISAFFIFFIIIYLVLIGYKKIGKKEYIDYKTIRLIVKKNKLKLNDKNSNKLLKICLLSLSAIIAIPTVFVFYSKLNYVLTMVVALGIFLVLILIAYYLLCHFLKKKGW